MLNKLRGWWWGLRVWLRGNSVSTLARFAERYIYGDDVPGWGDVMWVESKCSVNYCLLMTAATSFLKPGVKKVVLFTFTHCFRAREAVSFALMDDGEVRKAVHAVGECPFREYPSGGVTASGA